MTKVQQKDDNSLWKNAQQLLLHEQQFYIDILCIGKAIENEVCA